MQKINLYQIEKPSFSVRFTFRYALMLFFGFFLVILFFTGLDLVKHLKIKKELAVLNKEQIKKTKKLEIIKEKTAPEQTRSEVQAELEQQRKQKETKMTILLKLNSVYNLDAKGYAAYFEALSKSVVSGVWLTNLSFKDNESNLLLQGQALSADYIPQLVNALSDQPVFHGKTFELFKMVLDDKTQRVDFVLQTKSYQAS